MPGPGDGPVQTAADGAKLYLHRLSFAGLQTSRHPRLNNLFEGGGGSLYRIGWADGGAICMGAGNTLVAVSCRFEDNQASGRGGAIYAGGTSIVTLVACLFAGNGAPYGGAVYISNTRHHARGGPDLVLPTPFVIASSIFKRNGWLPGAINLGDGWSFGGERFIRSGSSFMQSPADAAVWAEGVDVVVTSSAFALNLADTQLMVDAPEDNGPDHHYPRTFTLNATSFQTDFASICAAALPATGFTCEHIRDCANRERAWSDDASCGGYPDNSGDWRDWHHRNRLQEAEPLAFWCCLSRAVTAQTFVPEWATNGEDVEAFLRHPRVGPAQWRSSAALLRGGRAVVWAAVACGYSSADRQRLEFNEGGCAHVGRTNTAEYPDGYDDAAAALVQPIDANDGFAECCSAYCTGRGEVSDVDGQCYTCHGNAGCTVGGECTAGLRQTCTPSGQKLDSSSNRRSDGHCNNDELTARFRQPQWVSRNGQLPPDVLTAIAQRECRYCRVLC